MKKNKKLKFTTATIVNIAFISGYVVMAEDINIISFMFGAVVVLIYWLLMEN